MSLATPDEYRAARTKTVTLSSGFQWRIRKLPIDAMSKFLDTIGVPVTPGMTKQDIEKQLELKIQDNEYKEVIMEAIQVILPAGADEPQITLENPAPEGALSLKEISLLDQFDLFIEIVDFQGGDEDTEKFRQKFAGKVSGLASDAGPPEAV